MENNFPIIKSSRKIIQSVDRALRILEEMSSLGKPMSLKDLSSKLSLNPTTTFHLLNTLMARGFVIQDVYTKRYKLGLKMLEFEKAVLDNIEFRNEIRPILESIMEETEETVNLVLFDKGEAIYVDQVQSKRASMFRMFTRIGTRVPLHCTGVGKVYLAHLPEDQVKAIVEEKGLPYFTENTITSLQELLSELEVVRQQGYAVDNEERERGVRCIAVPLFDRNGDIVAAVSVSGPTSRITTERIIPIASAIIDKAQIISEHLELTM